LRSDLSDDTKPCRQALFGLAVAFIRQATGGQATKQWLGWIAASALAAPTCKQISCEFLSFVSLISAYDEVAFKSPNGYFLASCISEILPQTQQSQALSYHVLGANGGEGSTSRTKSNVAPPLSL
jgi:hypothetical protein